MIQQVIEGGRWIFDLPRSRSRGREEIKVDLCGESLSRAKEEAVKA